MNSATYTALCMQYVNTLNNLKHIGLRKRLNDTELLLAEANKLTSKHAATITSYRKRINKAESVERDLISVSLKLKKELAAMDRNRRGIIKLYSILSDHVSFVDSSNKQYIAENADLIEAMNSMKGFDDPTLKLTRQ